MVHENHFLPIETNGAMYRVESPRELWSVQWNTHEVNGPNKSVNTQRNTESLDSNGATGSCHRLLVTSNNITLTEYLHIVGNNNRSANINFEIVIASCL